MMPLRPLINKVNNIVQTQIQPPVIIHPPIVAEPAGVKDERCEMDFSFFDKNKPILESTPSVYSETPKKSTKSRKTKTLSSGDVIVTDSGEQQEELPKHQTTEPYIDTYAETTNMLKVSVIQIDTLNRDIKQELDAIRASKVIKNKYSYISELTGTSSSLLGTKISAIREINKTITDCHNLELKRIKDLGIGKEEQNDDKTMMDMYNAFISTPVGAYNPLGPSIMDISMPGNNMNIVRTDISGSSGDVGYDNYLQTMTPEQNRMRLERNPNIKTVVVYDQGTGDRHFEIVDSNTGQPVPNMPKPADFILEDLYINPKTGTARNANMNVEYPLLVVGKVESLDEY